MDPYLEWWIRILRRKQPRRVQSWLWRVGGSDRGELITRAGAVGGGVYGPSIWCERWGALFGRDPWDDLQFWSGPGAPSWSRFGSGLWSFSRFNFLWGKRKQQEAEEDRAYLTAAWSAGARAATCHNWQAQILDSGVYGRPSGPKEHK